MLLTSPSPTPYDVRFRLLGFPVRIHPAFWLIALFLGSSGTLQSALVWVAAVLVSILVHELGHAFLQRWFGGRPEITLYAFGGFASAAGVRDAWWINVLVALAGPAAGLLLWSVIHSSTNFFGLPESRIANELARDLWVINWYWSLINLAPIWPLDGGRVARELLTQLLKPSTGVRASLVLSMACASLFAVLFGVRLQSMWNTILFGLLAYQSYEALRGYNASRGRW